MNIDRLLSEIEMAWNFIQHATRELRHLHRFGTPPRILGQGNDTTIQQRIALMELVRIETDHTRTQNLINRAFNPYHRYDKTLRVFTPNKVVWFHRRLHGWSKGIVHSIEHPMIHVRLQKKNLSNRRNTCWSIF